MKLAALFTAFALILVTIGQPFTSTSGLMLSCERGENIQQLEFYQSDFQYFSNYKSNNDTPIIPSPVEIEEEVENYDSSSHIHVYLGDLSKLYLKISFPQYRFGIPSSDYNSIWKPPQIIHS